MIPVRRLAFILLLTLSVPSMAVTGPVEFSGNGFTAWFGRQTRVFHDSTAVLTAEEVLAMDRFAASDDDVLNLGVSADAHWVMFDLRDRSEERSATLLIQYPEIDEIDVYAVRKGRPELLHMAGQRRPADRSLLSTPLNGFPLPVPDDGALTVLLRVRNLKQLQLPLAICDPGSFHRYSSTRNSWMGAFMGIMLVMVVYNLFVYLSIRDRSYLYYVAYILLVCATQMSFLGWFGYHVQPFSPWLAANASLILTCFTAIMAGAFMQRFLRVREQIPSFRRVAMVFTAIMLTAVTLVVAGRPLAGYQLAQAIVGLFAFYQIAVAERLRRRGSRPAMFFLLAWSMFLAGVMVFVLKDKDLLPFNAFTNYTMPAGSVAEVVLLSFGLADKINILRREKERSQAEALRVSMENERIIREQNAMLEQKVTERTHALQESNEHLKRTQGQLVNAEKMASLGQLTAGIAHEINNPVNFISSNIPPLRRNITEMMEVLQRYRSQGAGVATPEMKELRTMESDLGIDDSITETTEILNSIENGAGRTAEIVRGLRNFSRLDEADLKSADINECLRSTIAVLSPQVRDKVRIDMDFGGLPSVECYPGKLNQVFMNILTNGAQACRQRFPEGGGTITVRTRVIDSNIEVTIADNGPGFTPDVKARMFEPFFTTKPVGEGTGLGLSIVYGIIEKHNGSIEATSEPGMGASFRLLLPMDQQQASKRA